MCHKGYEKMKKIIDNISDWMRDLTAVFCNEWKVIGHDMGALIFFLALPLLYPVSYTLIYNPEVVDRVPVAIVDDCRSELSRKFVRDASAAPGIDVAGYASNLNEARQWMNEGKVYGVLRIPRDYASNIGSGRQATVEMYADMSLLLRYRALLAAVTDLQIKETGDITLNRVNMTGLETTGMAKMPIDSHYSFMGDPEQGFASFVMPGIVILILQQSMILGIALIGGTSRERRMRNGGLDPMMIDSASASASVWGKALCYFVLYIPLTMYVTSCIPEMFNLPHYGSPVQYLPFIVPMLFASAFLGQALLPLMKERESAFMIVVFTSVVFLFASGLTWPRYAMNEFWTWFSNLVPATWGVEGFIRINSNAATLAESSRPFLAMWVQTGVYYLFAWWSLRWIRTRSALEASRTKA